MSDRGGEEEIAIQARMLGTQLERHRANRHRVLQQAAEIGMVGRTPASGAGALWRDRAGRPADPAAQLAIAEQAPEQRLERTVVNLPCEMLEEPFELVQIAICGGQEPRRIGPLALGAPDRADIDLELIAKPLDTSAHVHEVASLEAPCKNVGVPERPSDDRAAAVTQLERRYGVPARETWRSLRAHAKHPVDLVLATQRGNGLRVPGELADGGGHPFIMYGASDAAVHLGPPS